MKPLFTGWRHGASHWRSLLLLALSLGHAAADPSLEDFGYRNMRVNGHESLGNRPLLVIMVNFIGSPALAHDNAYYDDFVFNFFNPKSVNGYILENSNARFFWSPAGTGIIGPLDLPATEKSASFAALVPLGGPLADELFVSNIVYKAMTTTPFPFRDFDANSDTTVTGDELGILIISNDGESSGMFRWTHNVRPDGSPIAVNMGLAHVSHKEGLNLIAHEMSHSLGTWDLYGSGGLTVSQNLSLMADAKYGTDIYHLDPWHKLQLGWSEPRIRSLRDGGVASLPATQLARPDAPVILYDPSIGPSEFFILEYRRTNSLGAGYDVNVAGSGLVVWHVKQDAGYNPVLVTRVEAGRIPAQELWRWCQKCKGLHYISNDSSPTLGPCPKGGQHSRDGSSAYLVVNNIASAPGQHGWRWCRKCQGLFFGPGESDSYCRAGGAHDGSESGDYSLVQGDPDAPGQKEWRWCRKCQGLFFGLNESESGCPKDSGTHDGAESGNYSVLRDGSARAVWSEGAPNFRHGGNTVWGSSTMTPYLRWLDDSETRTRLYVRPFNTGDGSITVEWWAEEDTWVDFNYFGIELGLFDFPYNTLAEGTVAVPWGGFLKIKTGSTAETMTINKRMTIQAFGGPVTIGR